MRRLADLVVRWPLIVIALWVALAVALPLTVPSLNEMAQKHPLSMLPGDAPSSVAARQMEEAFQEPGTDDLLLVVLTDEDGLGPEHEATYRKLVDALRDDQQNVVMLQEFIGTPALRSTLTSKDEKSWVLPVGLAGALGTPQSYTSFNQVSDLIERTTAGGPLEVHLAGPAATVADLTVAGEKDRLPIEIAIAVLVLLVLLVVYRNPVTMLLPLAGIGMSLVIAQSTVAALSELTGLGVSNQAMILLSAIIFGAGTDYAVFLISRYHDYVRMGEDQHDAVRKALGSVGKVITASAATVGVTFLAISFAKMGVFSTVGVSSAVGVGVAYLAAMTLPPALLAVVGPRGWIKPRKELTSRLWRRSGVRIVRRPWTHLVGSLLVLFLLAGLAGFATVQLRRPQGGRGLGAQLAGICRAGEALRHQPVHPVLCADPLPEGSAQSGGARRPRSSWPSGSPSCPISRWSAVSPVRWGRCRRSSGPPTRRASSAPGSPTARR